MNDWESLDITTCYSVVFLNVEYRLDLNAAVASIPDVGARPLKICMFTAADVFKPSIASAPQNAHIGCSSPSAASLYDAASPLFVDATYAGSPYVDCRGAGPSVQAQRNTIAPHQIQPMPLMAIYDARRQLTAYRLMPLSERPLVAMSPCSAPGQHITWEVEKVWKVDFEEAGWTDHPNDIRFVGSDHHLLVHHVNGDVTGVTLSDSRPPITALLDSRLVDKRAPDLPTSITRSPAARDYENWCPRTIITASLDDSKCVIKNFIESAPLVSGVEMFWSTPQSQFPSFCPIPVTPLRPFTISSTRQPNSSASTRGSFDSSAMIQQEDVLEPSSLPSVHQPQSVHASSPISPIVGSPQTSINDSSGRSLFSPNSYLSPIPRRFSRPPVLSSVSSEPFVSLRSCTVVQHAQPNDASTPQSLHNAASGESALQHKQPIIPSEHERPPPGIRENRFTRSYQPQYLPLLSNQDSFQSEFRPTPRVDSKTRSRRPRSNSAPSWSPELHGRGQKRKMIDDTNDHVTAPRALIESESPYPMAENPNTDEGHSPDFSSWAKRRSLESDAALPLRVSYDFSNPPRKLAEALRTLCGLGLPSDAIAAEGFWDDLKNEAAGVYVWCETAEELICLTVSLQCTLPPHQALKYMQSSSSSSRPYSHVNRSCTSFPSATPASSEGSDYRYRKMSLLTLDRKAPALKIFDIIAAAGTVTCSFCSSLFDSRGPFSRRPLTQWKFEKLSFLHPIISSFLSLGPPPSLLSSLDGYSLAVRLCHIVSGSPHFPQILELLLHEALEECVPLFHSAVKQYNADPSATHQRFLRSIESAVGLQAPSDDFLRVCSVDAFTPPASSVSSSSLENDTIKRKHSTISWTRGVSTAFASFFNLTTYENPSGSERATPLESKPSETSLNSPSARTQEAGGSLQLRPSLMLPTSTDSIEVDQFEDLFCNDSSSHMAIYHYCTVMYPAFRKLIRFLRLLKNFPDYYTLTIIAGIRKTEPLTTPAIVFPLMGVKPQELFVKCLQSQKLLDASFTLIILQYIVGPLEVRKQFVIPLFRSALEANRFGLVKSVAGFFCALYVLNSGFTSAFSSLRSSRQEQQDEHDETSSAFSPKGKGTFSALWVPMSLPPGGVAPPVVSGDAEGIDLISAAEAFVTFERIVLNTLIECVQQCQWIRLVCLVLSLQLDLSEWLQCEIDRLRKYFEMIELAEWEEFEKMTSSGIHNDKTSDVSGRPAGADGAEPADVVAPMAGRRLESSDRTRRKSSNGGYKKTFDQPGMVSFRVLITSFRNQFKCQDRRVLLHEAESSSHDGRSCSSKNATSISGTPVTSPRGATPASQTTKHVARERSASSHESSNMEAKSPTRLSEEPTSLFGLLTRSPHPVKPFEIFVPHGARNIISFPSRLDLLGSGADQFLEFLFLVFGRLDIPILAAAIAIACSDNDALTALYRRYPSVQDTVRRFTCNQVRRYGKLL